MHVLPNKTSAWPLALLYAGLVVFASLFPFAGWRAQGIDPLVFLLAPLPPPYWTAFDVISNLAGYVPLGFLLALALMRTGWGRVSLIMAALAASGLSFVLEFLQIYLPQRVPSNLDLALNSGGSICGAVLAGALERWGAIARWTHFKSRWFYNDARGALVLLVLWPLALLFPAAVPFGLGQVLERLEAAVMHALKETLFERWLVVRESPLEPLSMGGEMLCVALGLLVPILLGFCVIRGPFRRAGFGIFLTLMGLAVTALSSALSWGPAHAWDWLHMPTWVGLGVAITLAAAALAVSARGCAAIALLLVVWQLALLNNAPLNAYFSQTLQTWEQGRFIRFYGLGQWLGWLWPYTAMAYILARVWRREE